MARTPLGIPAIDQLLEAGPTGTRWLVSNQPGIDAEALMHQAAANHLEAGREVLYLTTSRAPDAVLRGLDEHTRRDLPLQRLHLIDLFSPLLGLDAGQAYTVEDPADPEQVLDVVAQAIGEHPGAVVCLESLSGMADQIDEQTLQNLVGELATCLGKATASITLFTTWPYGFGLPEIEEHFDAIVSLSGLEERVTFGQYFQVQKAAWLEGFNDALHPYKVLKPGGIHVYIPKLVVTGPYNAGKSTFVHTVSDTAVSVDRLGTTVALDHGHVTVDGVTADLFGTPGQARFDPILRTVAGKALGIIVLVDATDPSTFPRAKELLEKTVAHGLPVLVGANKQDLPGALSPKEVRARLDPPDHVPVLGVIGQEPTSARRLLTTMSTSIVHKGAMIV